MVIRVYKANKNGTSVCVKDGARTIMNFPARCRDLAEKMAQELNAGAVEAEDVEILKEKYADLKYERGVKVRGIRKREERDGESITPQVRLTDEARDMRKGFTNGVPVADFDAHLARLPVLLDQARIAEQKANDAQRDVQKLWAESDKAWARVADELKGIGGAGLLDAIKAAREVAG